jgi:hypothetical protein
MSFFSKKEEKVDTPQELDMLVTTIENIGQPYEVIGLVTAKALKVTECDPQVIARELIAKARAMNADAIVGFRYDVRINSINWTDQIGYGTAVKFK